MYATNSRNDHGDFKHFNMLQETIKTTVVGVLGYCLSLFVMWLLNYEGTNGNETLMCAAMWGAWMSTAHYLFKDKKRAEAANGEYEIAVSDLNESSSKKRKRIKELQKQNKELLKTIAEYED